VALVRHLQTNHVSPQFHIIHDDNFETILNDSPMDHDLADNIINKLFEEAREIYSEIEFSSDGTVIYKPPHLDDIWLDESERRAKRIEKEKVRAEFRDRWLNDNAENGDSNIPLPTSESTNAPPPEL
jgi:hypothetical protein